MIETGGRKIEQSLSDLCFVGSWSVEWGASMSLYQVCRTKPECLFGLAKTSYQARSEKDLFKLATTA